MLRGILSLDIQWNLSNQDSLKSGQPLYKGRFFLPKMPFLCALQPLKYGHLTNQDTFSVPRVSGLERFHYIHSGVYVHVEGSLVQYLYDIVCVCI